MLMPKRVKRRRVHRGRMTGKCTKGNKIAYGDYGLVALEPAWIKSNQIEAARVAMTSECSARGVSIHWNAPSFCAAAYNVCGSSTTAQ